MGQAGDREARVADVGVARAAEVLGVPALLVLLLAHLGGDDRLGGQPQGGVLAPSQHVGGVVGHLGRVLHHLIHVPHAAHGGPLDRG